MYDCKPVHVLVIFGLPCFILYLSIVLQMPQLFLHLGQSENSMTFWWFQRQTSELLWLYLMLNTVRKKALSAIFLSLPLSLYPLFKPQTSV